MHGPTCTSPIATGRELSKLDHAGVKKVRESICDDTPSYDKKHETHQNVPVSKDGWSPLDGRTSGPFVTGQMDSLVPSVLGKIDSLQVGWTSLGSNSDRTLSVTLSKTLSIVSNSFDRCQ